MPINLKYGQLAVTRGFLTPQRLQQVLSKQRQLADQGKKVSVRMILEKSKLLTVAQLEQLDRELNIKVVKKKTTKIVKGDMAGRGKAVTAATFGGDEELPDVSGSQGADPDATVYSPPPPDMQQRIKEEREKAKAAVRAKQEQEARSAGAPPSRQPARPQTAPPAFAEPEMMEPMMEADPFGQEPVQELERMDSGRMPTLSAEQDGFASPEAELAPSLDAEPMGDSPFAEPMGMDAPGLMPQDSGRQAQAFEEAGLAPEPEAMPEVEPQADAWGEEQPVNESFGSQDFAAPQRDINATVFSPRPTFAQAEPEPEAPALSADAGFDAFGDSESAPAPMSMGDDNSGDLGATLYSPPPPSMPGRSRTPSGPVPAPEAPQEADEPMAAPTAALSGPGRKGMPGMPAPAPKGPVIEDFANAPVKKRAPELDDVPTVKPREEKHPLRRGVTGETAAAPSQPAKGKTAPQTADDFVNAKPKKREPEPVEVDLPDDDLPAEPVAQPKPQAPARKSGRMPEARKPEPAAKAAKPEVSNTPTGGDEPKKGTRRVFLWFGLFFMLIVALVVIPSTPELQERVPQVKFMRDHPNLKPIYDKTEPSVMRAREMVGLPVNRRAAPNMRPDIQTPGNNVPANNAPKANE
jgi:hypothetical protein